MIRTLSLKDRESVMKLIYFTKFLKGLSAEQIGETAASLGFTGLDLAIRPGQAVNSANVSSALPAAMKIWRDRGITVPLATMEGTPTDPHKKETETIYAACAEHGIPNIKLGYWLWHEGPWSGAKLPYWKGVEQIRADLAEFQRLGEKFGVRSLVHTHCDNYYGVNASSARHLVNGFDPRHVGIYLDPAHLSADGETLAMGIDISGEYLHMVAAKNVRYQLTSTSGPANWKHDWCQLSEGLVNWPNALTTLKNAGYDGAISVHGEYSGPEVLAEILVKVKTDVDFLKQHLGVN